ncbi:MAG: transposase [Chloroflexota bacterium]
MRYLVDVLYPDAEISDVVLDNLNTHHYHSLVEHFGKVEADRIMKRLSFHFKPPHTSWLNMAEIEAWEDRRNAVGKPCNWAFTAEDARAVFRKGYPSPTLN